MYAVRTAARFLIAACIVSAATSVAWAHPGCGIVVDGDRRVWFMDTGFGLWQIDPTGHLTAQGGPGGHFLAIDRQDGFKHDHFSALEKGDVELARIQPTLLVATSYPIAVGSDGALYYPQVASKGRVRMMRMKPGQKPEKFADLPEINEVGFDGKPVKVEWVWGLAAGPEDSLYYTEQQAVRRIAADGKITTIAEHVTVPECERPPALKDAVSHTNLYGLDVAADGTVYVAASGCSAVLKITPNGEQTVVLRATDDWSPQGIAVDGQTLYVLEYNYVAATDRKAWWPRVRKVDADGKITLLAHVTERPDRGELGVRKLPEAVNAGMALPPRQHAAIVHFPLVLFFVSMVAAGVALVNRQSLMARGQLLLLFLVIAGFCYAAEQSGELASREVPYGPNGVPGVVWEVMHTHTYYASWLKTLAYYGAAASIAALIPWPKKAAGGLRLAALAAALLVAVVGSATAVATGHYGGELVYEHGLGSETLTDYLDEKAALNAAAAGSGQSNYTVAR